MKIILHWILISISVWITSKLVAGVYINPIWVALAVGAGLKLFNMFLKPIIRVLTLPLNLLTLGFFSLLINGALFWYLGIFIKGFIVETFMSAFIGAILVSFFNWILNKTFHFD